MLASKATSPRLKSTQFDSMQGLPVNFRIEPLIADHLDRCVEVFVAAFTKPDRFGWKPDDVRVRLQDLWNEPKRVGLVATEEPDQTVTGFAIGNFVQVADGPALRIGELCVHPSRQHFGLGSRLLLGMEELALEGGAHSAYLTVHPDSVDFCRRLGYERQDEWIAMGRRLREAEPAAED
jgi:ribosomal protein S18 acetylase RimI-like enzyme